MKEIFYKLGTILVASAMVASCSFDRGSSNFSPDTKSSSESASNQSSRDKDDEINSLLLYLELAIYKDLYREEYRGQSRNSKTYADDLDLEFYYRPELSVLSAGYGWREKGYPEIRKLEEQFVKNHRCLDENGKVSNYLQWTQKDRDAIQKDLQILTHEAETEMSPRAKSLLAAFYYRSYLDSGNTKEGLSWAYKAAEQGDSIGMKILAHAYAEGNGFGKDLIESLKWLLLAERARGYGSTERELKKERPSLYPLFHEIKNEAKGKAENWARNHPDAFFTPPDS